jgi:hypothetical protein
VWRLSSEATAPGGILTIVISVALFFIARESEVTVAPVAAS